MSRKMIFYLSSLEKGGVRLILCIALIIRLLIPAGAFLISSHEEGLVAPDTFSYLALARSLIQGRGFTRNGAPELERTPGYPLFLAVGLLSGHPIAVTVILQILLGCVTVFLVFRIAAIITGSGRAAAAAGLLMAVEPLSVLYCSRLLSETLFTTLICLGLYWIICFLDRRSLWHIAGSALVISAGIYVKPAAYCLPVAAAVFISWVGLRNHGGRLRLTGGSVLFFLICSLSVGAWQIRNVVETGYRGFSAISEMAIYYYYAAAVRAREGGEPYYLVQEEMGYRDKERFYERHPETKNLARAQLYISLGREGRKIIFSRPSVFASVYSRGMAMTLFDPGSADYLKTFGLYREGGGLMGELVDRGFMDTVFRLSRSKPILFWCSIALEAVLLFYLVAAVLSLVTAGCRGRAFILAWIFALYFILLSGGPYAHARFRVPVMPVICILAGCAIGAGIRGCAE